MCLALVILSTGCGDAGEKQGSNRHPAASESESALSEPLPFFDVKNSPDGGRYSQIARAWQTGDSTGARYGIVEFDRGTIAPGRRKQLPDPNQPHSILIRKATPELDRVLEQAAPARMLDIDIQLKRDPTRPSIHRQINSEVARGELPDTVTARRSRRKALLSDRAREIRQKQDVVLSFLPTSGYSVRYRCEALHCLLLTARPDAIEALRADEDVQVIDLVQPVEDNSDGIDVLDGTQIEQFVTDGEDGEEGSTGVDSDDVWVAAIEIGGVDNEHDAFRDCDGGCGTDYRLDLYDCTSGSCSSVSNFGPSQEADHATKVNGIMIGDLTDGQDATHTGSVARRERSGYAREARSYAFRAGSYNSGAIAAMDTAATLTPQPRIVNMSIGNNDNGDPTCSGQTSYETHVNDLYGSGSLLFFAAGTYNLNNCTNCYGSASDCQVERPGAAIGAFTVGAHGGNSPSHVRNGGFANTPWGGNPSEGQDRSIIDLTAPRCRYYIPSYYKNTNSPCTSDADCLTAEGESCITSIGVCKDGYRGGCGTSFAAPTATAAAVDFVDWFHDWPSGGSFIDTPGHLFANMLLMADGDLPSGSKLTTGYSHLTGAGRLRMRKWTGDGMDGPWGWASGQECIDDGEWYSIPVYDSDGDGDPEAVPADVDVLKAVVWWYDPGHELGNSIADVDLHLVDQSGFLLSSDDNSDNKERIFVTDLVALAGTNVEAELKIEGQNVSTDTVCGTDSVNVHYAFFYEESSDPINDTDNAPDRDDIYTEDR